MCLNVYKQTCFNERQLKDYKVVNLRSFQIQMSNFNTNKTKQLSIHKDKSNQFPIKSLKHPNPKTVPHP